MRIARFSHGGEVSYGLVLHQDGAPAEGHGVRNGVAHVDDPDGDADGGAGQLMLAQLAGHPFGGSADDIKLTGVRFALDQVRLLAPILPSKVVCIGRNYADHIAELGNQRPTEPIIFLKPSTSVVGAGDPIRRPTAISARIDYEGELAVVIGRVCRDVPPE